MASSTTPKWESCELALTGRKKHTVTKGIIFTSEETAWSYECYIRYFSSTGQVIFRWLAKIDQTLGYNPFNRAMGLPGGYGWELVSVQLGNDPRIDEDQTNEALILYNRVAFFKRPVVAGRAVDQPALPF